jgi:two-component system cell cycle sensor histidine kinase/response regulator CckA
MQSFARVRPTSAPSNIRAASGAPIVLFVSDDRDLREAAERALGGVGFEVIAAGHAGHAILACLGGPIDVLVTELSMRDTSGPALLEQARRYQPDLPVIYLAEAGTAEAPGVVVRPFTRDDLTRELARALAPLRTH